MISLTVIITIYFNVTMAWVLYFLYHSLTSVLPWSTCNNDWNTEQCSTFTKSDVVIGNTSYANYSIVWSDNATNVNETTNKTLVTDRLTASEEFWRYIYFFFI